MTFYKQAMPDIIKCIIVDDEPVARDTLETLLSGIEFIKVVSKCRSAIEAFNILNREEVDLVFLDINMPEVSGLSFAKSVNRDIKIIFTTAYREYAVEGFDLQAVDYLLKPVSLERLLQSINKFVDMKPDLNTEIQPGNYQKKEDHVYLRSERKMVKIVFNEVMFIESTGDYIKVILDKGSIITRETITNIEGRLPRGDFIRTHRSFIVSRTKIDSFTNEYIEIGKRQIPISRSYREEVLKELGNRK